MRRQYLNWISLAMLLLAILGFIFLGPLQYAKPKIDTDYNKYYSAFSLKNLRKDLNEYSKLVAASLDYYGQNHQAKSYVINCVTDTNDNDSDA
ncbi:ABC transporter ATP-binding protein [Paucilactobacillus nenjiangensis]|uniref:ABC transporter ATP-binding protein n=1 Tax=Paucilactobacillus nenjiangensis TaxID=1296540 RepID=UPI0010F55855|nr:ABC transporter ATP-binding protein [Paucilactobacillus nenjiangensis]